MAASKTLAQKMLTKSVVANLTRRFLSSRSLPPTKEAAEIAKESVDKLATEISKEAVDKLAAEISKEAVDKLATEIAKEVTEKATQMLDVKHLYVSDIFSRMKGLRVPSVLDKINLLDTPQKLTDAIANTTDMLPQAAAELQKFFDILSQIDYSSPQGQLVLIIVAALLGRTSEIILTKLPKHDLMRTVVLKVLDTIQIAKEHTQKSESDAGIPKNPDNTLNAAKVLTEDAFEIHIAALGFKKHNVLLSVNGHDLHVSGRATTILGPQAIKGVEKIDDHIFFDANKVSADLVDGYLVVRFPLGTKSTMVEGKFDVKWAEKSEEKSADEQEVDGMSGGMDATFKN